MNYTGNLFLCTFASAGSEKLTRWLMFLEIINTKLLGQGITPKLKESLLSNYGTLTVLDEEKRFLMAESK